MKLIKIKSLGIIVMLLVISVTSFSQNYEKQSPEVQNQMNLNKTNGVSIWKNITTSYNVYTEGLNSTSKETVLQRAQLQAEILSINIVENGKVILVCQGGTPFDIIKPIFSNMVTNITKIEDNNYVQKKANK